MLDIVIPGRGELHLTHLILDYNGTIALDGALIDGVAPRLCTLADKLKIFVITADTHGTVKSACNGLPVEVIARPCDNVAPIKASVIREIREHEPNAGVASIGNGFNDVQMLESSDLPIAIINTESCYGPLIAKAHIVVTSILDALDLFANPLRVRATLRG